MKVFVFGGDHHNTIGVIRGLGHANSGIEQIAIVRGNRKNCLTLTCKYVSEVYTITTQQEGLDILLDKRIEGRKQVLICCSDGAAEIVDKHLNELIPYYYLQNANQQAGRIKYYMDKERIANLAEECGFTIPKSFVFNIGDDVPKNMSYPCITKPLISIDGHKSDIITCNDAYSLLKALNTIKERGCSAVQIQQYIDKEYELSIVGCSLKGGDELILPGIIRKIREYPIKRGSSSFAVMLPWSEYQFDLQPVYKIMKEIGYTGLFSIEFLHCKGVDYFLEVNLRNDGNGAVSNAGGVNLPNLLYNYFLGNDISYEKKVIDNPVYFMRDDVDYCHVLEHRLSLFEWIKDWRRTNTFLLYNNLDKGPFKKRIKSIIKTIIKHIIGRQ